MRKYRDLDMVEQLGSGINSILKAYFEDIFKLSDNFFEICFYFESGYTVTGQVTPQVKRLLEIINGEMSRGEIMDAL